MIGRNLGERYQITRQLGQGGMGVVYAAHDTLLDRDVAVKVIDPRRLDPVLRERFTREARIVARLDHPHVLPVYDFGELDDCSFFVMPLVEGGTLRQLLERPTLRLGDAITIGQQVLMALAHGHEHGVVHRDVKPENILVEQRPNGVRARLADFGVALAKAERRLTQQGAIVGTPDYLSPEQVFDDGVDERADIYALGVVLYECVAGQPPFRGVLQSVLYRIMHEPATPLSELGYDVLPELEQLIMSCLAKEPAERPAAAALHESLGRCALLVADGDLGAALLSTIHASAPAGLAPGSRLIGRDRELGVLGKALDVSANNTCQVVLVAGEPGSGRRRLIEEAERLAQARGVRVAYGEFAELGQSYPYQGFGEIIEQCCRVSPSPDLSDLAGPLVRLFPALADVPRFQQWLDDGASAVEVLGDRTQMFEVMARALTRIAAAGPTMYVVARLHDADASLDAFSYITRRLASQPVLFVGSYQSSAVGRDHPLTRVLESFRGSRRFSLIELTNLTEADHGELVRTLLPGGQASDELLSRLFALTQGNPYFAIEMVRSLLDSLSIVQRSDGTWTASGSGALIADALPNSIHKAIDARLARLSDHEHAVLKLASVLGTGFEYRELEALCEDDEQLDPAIDALTQSGFVTEQRRGRVDRMAFSSALIQRAVHDAIPRRTRRRLHARAAAALVRAHKGRVKTVLGRLLMHYVEADDAEQVRALGLELGQKALSSFAAEDAMAAARHVLAFADDEGAAVLTDEGEAHAILAAAHRSKAELSITSRELELAARAFERAGATERLADVMIDGVKTAYEALRLDDTHRLLGAALPLLRQSDDPRLAELLILAATTANMRGDAATARAVSEEAARLRAPASDASPAAGGTLRVAYARPTRVVGTRGWKTIADGDADACAFDTLVAIDQWANACPCLAEAWTANDDHTEFTFTLRQGVVAHDGRLLSSADVQRSFERAVKTGAHVCRAFSKLQGIDEFVAGHDASLRGVRIDGDQRIVLSLSEPMPDYPSRLAEPRAAVAFIDDPNVGTGPFIRRGSDEGTVLLERHAKHFAGAAKLERIELIRDKTADEVAADFRAGAVDVVMDLPYAMMERLAADRRSSGARMINLDRKSTIFAVFNTSRALGANEDARRAVFDAVPVEAMVWRHLGPAASAAHTLIPSGIAGHDVVQRRRLTPEEVRAMFPADVPRALAVAVSPSVHERFGPMVDGLFEFWRELGFEVTANIATFESYRRIVRDPEGVDMLICGWFAEHVDPADFTETLFHSHGGVIGAYHSSPDIDQICDEARAEASPERRTQLYRKVDRHLRQSCVVLPLMGGGNACLVQGHVTGLESQLLRPFLTYHCASISRDEAPRERRGWLTVPITLSVDKLSLAADLASAPLTEVLSCCFEGLTREVPGADVVPWLAESIERDGDGSVYRVRLRDGLRFHDGRRVTSAHVCASWVHTLKQTAVKATPVLHFIDGADEVAEGRSEELRGVAIDSLLTFTIELDRPVPQFKAMLADLSASIFAPAEEGTATRRATEAVGTGPFRVKAFDPNRRIELEANPYYFRAGYPKSAGITFIFGVAPDQGVRRLVAGQVSLLRDPPTSSPVTARDDCVTLSNPLMATTALLFNTRHGMFQRTAARRTLSRLIDTVELAGQLGGRGLAAVSLLPPGILGHSPASVRHDDEASFDDDLGKVRLGMWGGISRFPAYCEALVAQMTAAGYKVDASHLTECVFPDEFDLIAGTWLADYPDADAMVRLTLHSEDGQWGHTASHPDVDALSRRAAFEPDPRVRRDLYQQIEELIQEHCLLIPLFHPMRVWVARKTVRGLSTETMGLTRDVDFSQLWVDS